MQTATIFPSSTAHNIMRPIDIYLMMLILHGVIIRPEQIAEWRKWQETLPYYLGFTSTDSYEAALQAHRDSAPGCILQIHDLVLNGVGELPAELIDSSRHYQTPEEQCLILSQLNLEVTKLRAMFFCFKRFYGVVRRVTRN